jgi:3-hydroxybutyryl-CoA dehydrogenase
MTIGIIGTGAMGRGITQLLVQASHPVMMFDSRPEALAEAVASLKATWQKLADKGRITHEARLTYIQMLYPLKDIRELSSCNLIIEAVVEDLAVKRDLFARLEGIVAPHAILATNTSSLSVTSIAAGCQRPQRIAGLHFFNPVPLMKVVEVIPGLKTQAEVVRQLDTLIKSTGHTPVRASDTPGFIVNHAGRGYGTEALRCLQEQVADIATIDRILTDQGGFKLGPFELMDLTALDVSHPVMESIYHQHYEEPRYRPSAITALRLAGGLLGRKSGEGFYEYQNGARVEAKEAAPPPLDTTPTVWVGESDPTQRHRLTSLLNTLKVPVRSQPSNDALILIAPLGVDASHAATAAQLDASRVIAIDLLKPDDASRRRVMMGTPLTQAAYRNAAHALLASDGTPVSVLRDSAGFVTQRVWATIINIACDMCQQGITSPRELDLAVTLGLGYPQGPLAMGDALGAQRVLQVLQGIYACTLDPRYRPSPWLRRRAELNASLLHTEA